MVLGEQFLNQTLVLSDEAQGSETFAIFRQAPQNKDHQTLY